MRLWICALFAASLFGQPPKTLQIGSEKLTAIQHASFYLEAAGKVLYVDPAMGDLSNSPKADFILITDIHGDHMSPQAIDKIKKVETQIYGPQAVADKIPGVKVIKNGDTGTIGPWAYQAIPMYNEKRGPGPGAVYHDKGRGNGYILTYGGKRLYVAGDTEGIPEMRALKNIDVALIPMNLPYTMPPEEAADAVKAFHPAIAVPYHYRGSDLGLFQKGLDGTGIEVKLLAWY